MSLNNHFKLIIVRFPLIALLLVMSGCYQTPLEKVKASHQYSAKQLIEEWRSHAARKPLPLVHNDDYYAPYSPPIRKRNTQVATPANPAYYYDPRVDNPQAYMQQNAPYITDIDDANAERYSKDVNNNVVTHDLLYAY